MTFKGLNREQITQLKQSLLCERFGDRTPSWGELANVDELVTDEEVKMAYGECVFTEDDFV